MNFESVPRLGFGCASLGSRVGRKPGIRALSAAFDAGVTWYDLAPSYGDGQAEEIFSDFSSSRRDEIFICTKCGIEPLPTPWVSRLVRPLVRAAVGSFPSIRRLMGYRGSPAKPEVLTGVSVTDSLERSLRRLRTDRVDVLALHDPTKADIENEDVARALEAAVTLGKARRVGVAGSADVIVQAITHGLGGKGAGGGVIVGHVQVGTSEFWRVEPLAATNSRPLCVTHSVYSGRQGQTASDGSALHDALQQNPNGVVLVSMFNKHHLAENVDVLRHQGVRPCVE